MSSMPIKTVVVKAGAKYTSQQVSELEIRVDELEHEVVTLDTAPTEGSTNGVTSGGVYTALQGKQDTLTFASDATCRAIIGELS